MICILTLNGNKKQCVEQIDDANVQVEWAFSISGNIVTDKRSCLKPSNVDML